MVFPHTYRTEHTETKTTSSTYGEFYEWNKMAHVKLEPEVIDLLKYVDDVKSQYIEDLKEVVAIPSISGIFKHRKDVSNILTWVEKWFDKLKIKYERFDMGWEKIDGLCVKKPTVILGSIGNDPCKKTICIYNHLDVTSPEGQEWSTDPWSVVEINRILYGKGVAYGKGILLCWFHAIEAYEKHRQSLPVNFKFIIEATREQKSEGLEALLSTLKQTFLTNIDSIILCDTEWLGQKYPCLSYGCAGTCRFEITVEKSDDSDPKKDMDEIFSYIVNENDKILIPLIHKYVEQITPAEESIYDAIDFNFDELVITLPENKKHWDKLRMLMSFWRLPAIIVGDDEICNCEKNDTTTIKRKFVLKIVPKLTPDIAADIVTTHVYNVCKEINCQSKVECEMVYGARPWLVDFKNHDYTAARRAIVQIYKEDPNMIREDCEIPILLMLRRVIGCEVVLLPIANRSCNARGANENITLRNFFEGTKLLIAFIKQLSYPDFS